MASNDYYRSLGVARDASADDIQRAYRKMARKFHPDVSKEPNAEERFKEISTAYEVLKDPEQRRAYDRFGPDFRRMGGGGGGFDGTRVDFGDLGGGFGSIFENLFGGQGGFGRAGSGPRRPARGADQEARIALTLEEAAAGGTRDLTLTDSMSGRSQTHTVKLPPGVRPDQKIRLAGRGDDQGTGRPGDLYLRVEIRPHSRFRLDGTDLYTTVPVAPWEAALGGKVRVPTLGGNVTVKIPAGASTGRRIVLRGKGFPNPKSKPGDLYAEIKIVVPDELSDRERALFQELADISSFRPR